MVNDIAPAVQRAEVLSSYLIAVYLGNSVPIIGVGVLAAATSAATAHAAFAAVIAALAVATLLAERRDMAAIKAAE